MTHEPPIDPEHSMSFTVPGVPVPKARPRKGKSGNMYTPGRTTSYEETVAVHAMAAMGRARWPRGCELPIAISLTFAMPDRRRVDVDNLCKNVLDALNKLAFHDDSQVLEQHTYKTVDRERPRVDVRMWTLAKEAA